MNVAEVKQVVKRRLVIEYQTELEWNPAHMNVYGAAKCSDEWLEEQLQSEFFDRWSAITEVSMQHLDPGDDTL